MEYSEEHLTRFALGLLPPTEMREVVEAIEATRDEVAKRFVLQKRIAMRDHHEATRKWIEHQRVSLGGRHT